MDRRRRVVHLTTVHDPYDTRILRRECAMLARQDALDVHLLNAKGVRDRVEGVQIAPFDAAGSRWRRMTVSTWKALRAAQSMDADLYHLHDPELLPAALALKLSGRRVVYDCHENFVEKARARSWIPRPLRGLYGRAYGWLARRILPRLDGLVAATEGIAADLPARRTVVLRNLPDLDAIRAGLAGTERQAGLVLYTGGLTPNRGIEQVVAGLRGHCREDWRLVIVGSADAEVRARLQEALRDDRIDFRGRVAFAEVVRLMGTAAVGVVCNQARFDYQNALPNKLFEYMAAGLPVVCSDFPQWRAIVDGYGCGVLCDSGDPRSIGGAVESLLCDPEGARLMGRRGQAAVEESLSLEPEVQRLRQMYGEILQGA
ncbi:MAG TPA: glycosyltransferase family 4 protein [Steroidobacteraceae bacterium]|nr:glycosyltransferase family 4 protein [Steroidobacteraceae bacterium]